MEVKKDLIGKKTPSLGAIAKKHKVSVPKLRRQLALGHKVEREHTKSGPEAKEIARDHLAEIPDYYTRLAKMEKEAGVHEGEVVSFDKARPRHKRPLPPEHNQYGVLRSDSDYFSRDPKKKEAHMAARRARWRLKEWVDPIEVLHNANRRRILQGAKEGKYWLLRSEDVEEAWGPGPRDRIDRKKKRPRYKYDPNATSVSSGGGMKEESREYLIKKIVETTTSGAIGGRPMPMAGDSSDPAFGGRNKFNRKQLKFAVDQLIGVSKKSVRHPLV